MTALQAKVNPREDAEITSSGPRAWARETSPACRRLARPRLRHAHRRAPQQQPLQCQGRARAQEMTSAAALTRRGAMQRPTQARCRRPFLRRRLRQARQAARCKSALEKVLQRRSAQLDAACECVCEPWEDFLSALLSPLVAQAVALNPGAHAALPLEVAAEAAGMRSLRCSRRATALRWRARRRQRWR
ncbi:hypothetical protein WJX81_000284 [Elliptochloris bilobata]|uniref:Uncharacterized protein n=1 Tax=Elliptochloris bilobata TaxID=381761 RepID=A0AAW1QN12_9CHLO